MISFIPRQRDLCLAVSIFIVLVVQIPLIIPFVHSGFFPTHDDVQVVRVFEMFQAIKYGDLPPRWSSGLLYGHGYPLFNFYAPFTYLLGVLFVFVGANFLLATKIVFISAFFIGALGMFYLVKKWMGIMPALVSSIIFSLVPYRAVEVYVRGALAEFFAYSLFPWILWANLKVYDFKNSSFWVLPFAILFALLILTHSISGFIFGSFLFLFNIFYLFSPLKEKKSDSLTIDDKVRVLKNLLKGVVLAAGLSTFYWLPLIYEMKFVKLSLLVDFPYYNFFLTLNQIWESPWGFGGFHGDKPMSLQLGKVLITGSVAALFLNTVVKTKLQSLVWFLGGMMIIFIFLELKFSAFVWENISFLPLIQFPWRYHIIITVFGAILVGSLLYIFQSSRLYKRNIGKYLFIVLSAVITILAFKESAQLFRPRAYYEGTFVAETTTWDDEYLPVWVKIKPKNFTWPEEKIKILNGQGEIKDIEWGYLSKKFTAELMTDSDIRIAHIYYPGWIARVNGQDSEILFDNPNGFMTIKLPKGISNVTIHFERTWWRLSAELISLLTFSYIAVAFLKKVAQRY